MKHKLLCLICALALLLPLASCRREPWDTPEPPTPSPTIPAESAPAATLEELLARLTGADIADICWPSGEEKASPEELAALLNGAAEHVMEHEPLTLNGSDTDAVWFLEVWVDGQGSRGSLNLWAGLEENIVEVFTGDLQPEGRLWVEDEALYQLVRTSMDQERAINETYYEKYRDLVDGYYDTRLEELRDAGYASWELTEFLGVIGTTKEDGKGAVAFRMQAAFRTDPPELAPQRIAGGAYVDSQLRVHGLDWQSVYLVTLDGEPVGIAFGEEIIDFIEDNWGKEVDPEALRAAVAAATREG